MTPSNPVREAPSFRGRQRIPEGGISGRPEHLEAALASGDELRSTEVHYVSLSGEAREVEDGGVYASCIGCGALCEPQVTRHYQDGIDRHFCSLCMWKRLQSHLRRWLLSYEVPLEMANDPEAIREMAEAVEGFYASEGPQVGTTVRFP